jgi:hypothetical protein
MYVFLVNKIWVFFLYEHHGKAKEKKEAEKGQNKRTKFFFFSLLCWVGYIVAFTKVLGMYQLSHNWIHLFTAPLYPFSPDSCNSFNRYHYYIYMHVYTFFGLYSLSYFLFPPPSPSPCTGPVPPSKTSKFLWVRAESRIRVESDSTFFHFTFPYFCIPVHQFSSLLWSCPQMAIVFNYVMKNKTWFFDSVLATMDSKGL